MQKDNTATTIQHDNSISREEPSISSEDEKANSPPVRKQLTLRDRLGNKNFFERLLTVQTKAKELELRH